MINLSFFLDCFPMARLGEKKKRVEQVLPTLREVQS